MVVAIRFNIDCPNCGAFLEEVTLEEATAKGWCITYSDSMRPEDADVICYECAVANARGMNI